MAYVLTSDLYTIRKWQKALRCRYIRIQENMKGLVRPGLAEDVEVAAMRQKVVLVHGVLGCPSFFHS